LVVDGRIGWQQRQLRGVLIEEALVLLDRADVIALLLQRDLVSGSARLVGRGAGS